MSLVFALYIFLEILTYVIFADVILSWLTLIGLNIRPKFLADIIDPLYENIRKIIPTSVGPLDFTPIVALLIIMFLIGLLEVLFPGSNGYFQSYFK